MRWESRTFHATLSQFARRGYDREAVASLSEAFRKRGAAESRAHASQP